MKKVQIVHDHNPEVECEISAYIHCAKCLEELPAGETPANYARTQCGLTKHGLQVWCVRHDCNITNMVISAKGRAMKPKLYRVWVGWYRPADFKPHNWSQNPPQVIAAMQICEPVDLDTAQKIAHGYNRSEIKALNSIDATFFPPPRMWAIVVPENVRIVRRKLYRILSAETLEPTRAPGPSAN